MGTRGYTTHCRVAWWTVRICGNTSESTTLSYRFFVTGGLSTNLLRLVVINHMRDGVNTVTFPVIRGPPRTFFCVLWCYSEARGICVFFWEVVYLQSNKKKTKTEGRLEDVTSPYNLGYDEYKHWWSSNMKTHHVPLRQQIHTKLEDIKSWTVRIGEETHPNKQETTKTKTMNTNHTLNNNSNPWTTHVNLGVSKSLV